MPQHSTATFTDHAAIKTVHFSVTDDPDDRVIATVELFATPASATYSKLGGSLRDLHVSRPLRPYECVGCVADEFVTQLVHKDPRRPARATVNGRAYALPGVGAEGVDPDTREGRAILELFQAVQALDTRGNIRPDLAYELHRWFAQLGLTTDRHGHRPTAPHRTGRDVAPQPTATPHDTGHRTTTLTDHAGIKTLHLSVSAEPDDPASATTELFATPEGSTFSAIGGPYPEYQATRPARRGDCLGCMGDDFVTELTRHNRRARLVRATVNGRAYARPGAGPEGVDPDTREGRAILELFQAAQALDTRDNTRPDIVDELHVWFARLGLTAETTTP